MNNPRNITKTLRKALICVGILALVGFAVFASVKSRKNKSSTIDGFACDTFYTVTVYGDPGKHTQAVLDGTSDLIKYYEKLFSATDKESELYRINHRAQDVYRVDTDPELAELIEMALYYCRLTDGAFDITIYPVKELWDFNADDPKLPGKDELEAALKKVDYRKVRVEGSTVIFEDSTTMLDLGAAAKGYITDKLREYLVAEGVKSGIINLGGNVACIGKRPDGSDFTVGLEDPWSEDYTAFTTVAASDRSVVTSGVYQRFFMLDGVRYHHILDPATGYPYDNGLVADSIICRDSAEADILSTCAFCLGPDRGPELIRSLDSVEGYFVREDRTVIHE